MFYEGREKRLEIIITGHNLLEYSESFWIEMVSEANTNILSQIKNKHISAYLLSESSLFVWHNKILLITCGNTHLVKAAQYFQKKIPKKNIISLLFHRHQAIQPNRQKSSFEQDSQLLTAILMVSLSTGEAIIEAIYSILQIKSLTPITNKS
ncbi:hypothetical protein [Psychromonas sp. MME2]|uniref:hypothetical protein n=1 Tax=Psychromonas sp. MME2 TaxID=3231033 RepID=UPI00339C9B82